MIKVLIVDDSLVAREVLSELFSRDPRFQVVGMARNGEEGVRMACELAPDVITMDLEMPGMDGFQATRAIMESCPRPIVIVSGNWTHGDVDKTMKSLAAGAVSAMPKPSGVLSPESETSTRELLDTVAAMSEVKVIRRRSRTPAVLPGSPATRNGAVPPMPHPRSPESHEVLVIGASTGGPPVLHTLLSGLPQNFRMPILVVQHITQGFLGGLVDWLDRSIPLKVTIARDGERALPGMVYFGPDDHHLEIDRDLRIHLTRGEREHGSIPSVSCLFRSAATNLGSRAVGILLTGMGRDGAAELLDMRRRGALTIAQDKESSVVWGMPGEAVRLNAACHILPPQGIAELLNGNPA